MAIRGMSRMRDLPEVIFRISGNNIVGYFTMSDSCPAEHADDLPALRPSVALTLVLVKLWLR